MIPGEFHWNQGCIKKLPRANVERLGRWLGIARPDVLPSGLLAHEVLRRIRSARSM